MVGFLEGLKITLKTAGRKPVTAEYPEPEKRLEVQDRYMGFPALTWDGDVDEPYCTGCMVCIRNCPTQCMSAQMKDNPLHAEGKSRRRKIIDEFEINLGRCILCGICVDVCNFDAIEMSHEHELSKYERNGNRVDLPRAVGYGQALPGIYRVAAEAAGEEQRRAASTEGAAQESRANRARTSPPGSRGASEGRDACEGQATGRLCGRRGPSST